MNIREPPKPAAILATPLNVEESRAQRLQRSQARFRDRGGIFVPSSRSKLADILLGKASPLKKPRRSVSASPTPHPRILTHGAAEGVKRGLSNATRQSPRKKPRKSTHAGRDVDGEDRDDDGGPSGLTSAKVPKAASKGKGKSKKKLPITHTGEEDVQSGKTVVPPKKSSKAAPKKTAKKNASTSSKPPSKGSKPSRKPKDTGSRGDGEDRPKSKAKRSTAESKAIVAAHPPVFISTVTTQTISKTKPISTSGTTLSANKPLFSRRRKSSQVDSDSSEDEYVPSKGTQKDVEELHQARAAKAAARAKAKAKAQASGKSASTSAPSSSKSSAPPSKPPVKAPPEKSRPGAPQLSAIIEEDEEDEVPPVPPSKSSSAKGKEKEREKEKASASRVTSSSSSSSKKRHADEADLDVEPSSKSKRSKSTNSKESTKVSKKRPRPTEPDEDNADDGTDASGKTKKPAKRKKASKGEDEEVDEERQPMRKLPASSKTKSSTEGKGKGKGKPRSASQRPTKTAKRKENSVGPPSAVPPAPAPKVASQRGPPKSVLLRIQQNAKLEDVDNDPDPIDFLS
ncbi:unnamed protein product [Cyclocybe aegerita]|uniref:Uncharacterized protein n=1 Tax=Cyclocybe aegerita TaxID=1973307 RepID=A0A8S0WH60_CYCAE|nr:unnamed protein product [Cyclocybe aegerita]